MKIARRQFLGLAGVAAGSSVLGFPALGRAQNEVIGGVLRLPGRNAPIGGTNRKGRAGHRGHADHRDHVLRPRRRRAEGPEATPAEVQSASRISFG